MIPLITNTMAEPIPSPPAAARRCAVVTGANRGMGFETCRQLVANGVTVVLTAMDEEIGVEALHRLRALSGVSADEEDDYVLFHQLDVVDPVSVASLVQFIDTKFGKLNILINNAGISGVLIEGDILLLQQVIEKNGYQLGVFEEPEDCVANGRIIETHELAKQCLEVNYYGAKRMTEAFLPLLQRSDSPTIVNVSSLLGSLKLLCNPWAINVLRDVERLTEERIDEVIKEFLNDFEEEDGLKSKNWCIGVSAYKVSKAAMNAYTRLVANKYPRVCMNSVCPGYVKTDITGFTGRLSVEEGAESIVKLALLPYEENNNTKPSGLFFSRQEIFSSF